MASGRWTRRRAVGAGTLALAAVGVGAPRVRAQRGAVGGGGGIAGGGVAETEEGGEAQFVLFATRLLPADGGEGTVFGTVRWVDPSWESRGVDLTSTEVAEYGPPGGDQESRERVLRGRMSDGEGEYPFSLRVVVSEEEDELGGDTISLVVGARAGGTPAAGDEAAGDLDYEVEATVSAGGVRLLSFDEANTA